MRKRTVLKLFKGWEFNLLYAFLKHGELNLSSVNELVSPMLLSGDECFDIVTKLHFIGKSIQWKRTTLAMVKMDEDDRKVFKQFVADKFKSYYGIEMDSNVELDNNPHFHFYNRENIDVFERMLYYKGRNVIAKPRGDMALMHKGQLALKTTNTLFPCVQKIHKGDLGFYINSILFNIIYYRTGK